MLYSRILKKPTKQDMLYMQVRESSHSLSEGMSRPQRGRENLLTGRTESSALVAFLCELDDSRRCPTAKESEMESFTETYRQNIYCHSYTLDIGIHIQINSIKTGERERERDRG